MKTRETSKILEITNRVAEVLRHCVRFPERLAVDMKILSDYSFALAIIPDPCDVHLLIGLKGQNAAAFREMLRAYAEREGYDTRIHVEGPQPEEAEKPNALDFRPRHKSTEEMEEIAKLVLGMFGAPRVRPHIERTREVDYLTFSRINLTEKQIDAFARIMRLVAWVSGRKFDMVGLA